MNVLDFFIRALARSAMALMVCGVALFTVTSLWAMFVYKSNESGLFLSMALLLLGLILAIGAVFLEFGKGLGFIKAEKLDTGE